MAATSPPKRDGPAEVPLEVPQGNGSGVQEAERPAPQEAVQLRQLRSGVSLLDDDEPVELAAFDVVNNSTQRKKAPDFQLRTRNSLGLFAIGEKLKLVAQSKVVAIFFEIEMPKTHDVLQVLKNINELRQQFQNSKTEQILEENVVEPNTKIAIQSNLDDGMGLMTVLRDEIKSMENYAKHGHQVDELPIDFNRYCQTTLRYNLKNRAAKVIQQITSMKPPTVPAGANDGNKIDIGYDFLTNTQESVTLLTRLVSNLKNFNVQLESLTNYKLTPFLSEKMQENECLEGYTTETSQVQSCVIYKENFVCNVEIAQSNKDEDFGYEIIAISYPGFITGLYNTLIQNSVTPSLVFNRSNCTKTQGDTTLYCRNIIWTSNACFRSSSAQEFDGVFSHCDLQLPPNTSPRITEVKKGYLVDNLQQGATVRIEEQHQLNKSIMMIPFSFSFALDALNNDRSISARLPFDKNKAVKITWFSNQQIKKMQDYVKQKTQLKLRYIFDSPIYELFTLIIQILSVPVILTAFYKLSEYFCCKKLCKTNRLEHKRRKRNSDKHRRRKRVLKTRQGREEIELNPQTNEQH